jgi:hypothetical protein
VLGRPRNKSRAGTYVSVAFSREVAPWGFASPTAARPAGGAARPEVFELPPTSDLRYHWVVARTDALDVEEMRELVLDAWRMVVPKKVAREHLG